MLVKPMVRAHATKRTVFQLKLINNVLKESFFDTWQYSPENPRFGALQWRALAQKNATFD